MTLCPTFVQKIPENKSGRLDQALSIVHGIWTTFTPIPPQSPSDLFLLLTCHYFTSVPHQN